MDLPYLSPELVAHADDVYSSWQRHLDEGRLPGAGGTMSAEVRAQVEATDALFRGYARDRRMLERHEHAMKIYYRELSTRGMG